MDWSVGRYERTAAALAPAAEVAVATLAPQAGERVLDVACGTGNAALVAARAGASVVGVDLAERLVAVARERAAHDGVPAEFVVGDATALPAADGAFDAAVSVFGVIFADAEQAASELLRVVRPGGRIVVTTWLPGGATPKALEAVREALGAPPQVQRWSDPAVVRSLFGPRDVAQREHALAFTAESPSAYVTDQVTDHPLWRAAESRLRDAGVLEAVLARVTAIYAEANEDPHAFRITTRYLVSSVHA